MKTATASRIRGLLLSGFVATLVLGCAAEIDPDEEVYLDSDLTTTLQPDYSVPVDPDPFPGQTVDDFPIPAEELASGTTYDGPSGSETDRLARSGCNGILVRYRYPGGRGSACLGRPCKSAPGSTACAVRKTISRYFSSHPLQALEVAYCESRLDPHAGSTHQYHGLYQLSASWRDYYNIGAGYGIKDNVSAAWRIKSRYGGGGLGWQPWQCKPGW